MTDLSPAIHIRPARLEDGPLLSTLIRSMNLFPRMASESEEESRQRVSRHLEASLEGRSHSIHVATDDEDRLLGYIAVHWLPYLFLPGPEGFISELFIADAARGMGIGRRLLETIEGEAVARGCSRLQLINFRDRESYRRRFYEKNGWEERPDGASFVRRLM